MTDPKAKLLKRLAETGPMYQKKRSARMEAIHKCLCVRFDADMGYRLSIIRRRMNFRQRDLAKALGVSRQALAKVELGKTALSNIGYLQLKSALDRPNKNYFNFLFFGPPKSKWYEFQSFASLRAAGAKPDGKASDIINDYEMI